MAEENDVVVTGEEEDKPLFILYIGSKKFYVDFYWQESYIEDMGTRKVTSCNIYWYDSHDLLQAWGHTIKHPLDTDNPLEGWRYSFKNAVKEVAGILGYNAKKTKEFSSKMRNAFWKAKSELVGLEFET